MKFGLGWAELDWAQAVKSQAKKLQSIIELSCAHLATKAPAKKYALMEKKSHARDVWGMGKRQSDHSDRAKSSFWCVRRVVRPSLQTASGKGGVTR